MNELTIRQKIYEIRGQRVMLDFDLAAAYGVETAQLKRQVRRNIDRFEGEDFMFEVSHDELLRCQIGTSSWGGSRYGAFAFTMLGVAMLSSVLRSEVAIRVNRDIMRAFVSLRQIVMFPDTSRKFPKGYVLEVDREELISLRSRNLTANNAKSRVLPKAFTEKGLYMLN